LDEIAREFMVSTSTRQSLLDRATKIVDSLTDKTKELGKFYTLTMKRIIEKGEKFAADEALRLKRLIDSGSVNAKNVEQFSKRLNIVKQFTSAETS